MDMNKLLCMFLGLVIVSCSSAIVGLMGDDWLKVAEGSYGSEGAWAPVVIGGLSLVVMGLCYMDNKNVKMLCLVLGLVITSVSIYLLIESVSAHSELNDNSKSTFSPEMKTKLLKQKKGMERQIKVMEKIMNGTEEGEDKEKQKIELENARKEYQLLDIQQLENQNKEAVNKSKKITILNLTSSSCGIVFGLMIMMCCIPPNMLKKKRASPRKPSPRRPSPKRPSPKRK